MGWPRRIHSAGLIYHVINRGNNRQAIFLEAEDYLRYLRLLYHYKKKYGFKLFAFCLMSNHVHLLLQVNSHPLSKIMQAMTIAHTKHYHFKYRCCGHVWQGRFRSPVVSDDEHLLRVMSYIEQNPLRANIVKQIDEYRYSSYKLNVRQKDSKLIDREENPIWKAMGKDTQERINGCRRYLAERIAENNVRQIQKGTRGIGDYMTARFKNQIAEMLPKKRRRGRPRKNGINC